MIGIDKQELWDQGRIVVNEIKWQIVIDEDHNKTNLLFKANNKASRRSWSTRLVENLMVDSHQHKANDKAQWQSIVNNAKCQMVVNETHINANWWIIAKEAIKVIDVHSKGNSKLAPMSMRTMIRPVVDLGQQAPQQGQWWVKANDTHNDPKCLLVTNKVNDK